MKIIHFNAGEKWPPYYKNRKLVVSLYNEGSKHHQEDTSLDPNGLTNKSYLHFFGVRDVVGGILVEQLLNQKEMALITFAAIGESDRKKGIGTWLVKEAEQKLSENGIQLVGVQINALDDRTFWNKLGFIEEIEFGNGVALINLKPEI